jgi:hypothetical protein
MNAAAHTTVDASHDSQSGAPALIRRVPYREANSRKVGAQDAGAAAGSPVFAWHSLQRTMPRMLHMRQMNVPQFTHGYPSDARSSFPHERQTIASCSLSSGIL